MWGSLCEVFDQQPVDDTTKLTNDHTADHCAGHCPPNPSPDGTSTPSTMIRKAPRKTATNTKPLVQSIFHSSQAF